MAIPNELTLDGGQETVMIPDMVVDSFSSLVASIDITKDDRITLDPGKYYPGSIYPCGLPPLADATSRHLHKPVRSLIHRVRLVVCIKVYHAIRKPIKKFASIVLIEEICKCIGTCAECAECATERISSSRINRPVTPDPIFATGHVKHLELKLGVSPWPSEL